MQNEEENQDYLNNLSDDAVTILRCYAKLHSNSKNGVFFESFKKKLDTISSNNELDYQLEQLKNYPINFDIKSHVMTVTHIRKISTNIGSRAFITLESIKSFATYLNYLETLKEDQND